MMTHKECFQKYGQRRPLKLRRRLARLDRRQLRAINRHERDGAGAHWRWWYEGQAALQWDDYARDRLSAAEQEAMIDEMPF